MVIDQITNRLTFKHYVPTVMIKNLEEKLKDALIQKNQSVMISVWVSLAPMNPRKEKRSLLTHMPIPLAT